MTPAAKISHPHSPENWQSYGDLNLVSTLLIIAFVLGGIFGLSYVAHRRGWFAAPGGKGKKGPRYEMLPRHTSD